MAQNLLKKDIKITLNLKFYHICYDNFNTLFVFQQGICCAFNMDSAEEIFIESEFTEIIQTMQTFEKEGAFDNSSKPDWYLNKGEPKSQAGINKGLSVTLDAHSDLLDSLSVVNNYNSLTAMVGSPRDFPLTLQKVGKLTIFNGNICSTSCNQNSVMTTNYI